MDLGSTLILVILAALVFALPLIGDKWSAITSLILFGILSVYGIVGYFLHSQNAGFGISQQLANLHLWIIGISLAMIVLTILVYRSRRRKKRAFSE